MAQTRSAKRTTEEAARTDDLVKIGRIHDELNSAVAQWIRRSTDDPSVPWSEVMRVAMDKGGLTAHDIKRIVRMSGSTISRWRSGDVEPHDVVRRLSGQRIADFIGSRPVD